MALPHKVYAGQNAMRCADAPGEVALAGSDDQAKMHLPVEAGDKAAATQVTERAAARLSIIGDNDPDTTLFQQPWWLEAVSDGAVRSVTAGDGKNAYLWWPYVEQRWAGFSLIGAPPLAHTLGPVIRLPAAKPVSQASQHRKLIKTALAAFPPADGFTQTLDPEAGPAIDYAMAGFEVGVRYTYRIDCSQPKEALWRGMKDKARNTVRRAREAFTINDQMSVMEFYDFYEANLEKFGRINHHDVGVYLRLTDALKNRSRHVILTADDKVSGAPCAAVMLVWDANFLYYLRATYSGGQVARGAPSLLVWEAIKLASEMGLAFDSDAFLGRSGAVFVEAFGATPAERMVISRRSDMLKVAEAVDRRWRKRSGS